MQPDWQTLGLSQASLELVSQAGFAHPTPVQAETIPLALEGVDVISSAQTGTGKTASFVLPMADRFAGREGTYGLILAPTREIAQQIQQNIDLLAAPRGIRSIVLIGGVNMRHDDEALATYPHIIVATPGRLCDHLDRGNIWLDFIEVAVLDECDRMLDMGFSAQLSRIMEEVPSSAQILLFSATIPPEVDRLAHKILKHPKRVTIGETSSAAETVEQRLLWVRDEAKMRELMHLMREEPGSIMVFTRSKDSATRLWRSLHSAGVYDATFIHSDRTQAHREQALQEFKEGKYRVLIATDVAARGLHVDSVAHVVNYELPIEAENYIHRIGRTGRAGQTGRATTFVSDRDKRLLHQIERLLGREIPALNSAPADRHASERPRHSHHPHNNDRPNKDRGDRAPSRAHDKKRRKRRRGPSSPSSGEGPAFPV